MAAERLTVTPPSKTPLQYNARTSFRLSVTSLSARDHEHISRRDLAPRSPGSTANRPELTERRPRSSKNPNHYLDSSRSSASNQSSSSVLHRLSTVQLNPTSSEQSTSQRLPGYVNIDSKGNSVPGSNKSKGIDAQPLHVDKGRNISLASEVHSSGHKYRPGYPPSGTASIRATASTLCPGPEVQAKYRIHSSNLVPEVPYRDRTIKPSDRIIGYHARVLPRSPANDPRRTTRSPDLIDSRNQILQYLSPPSPAPDELAPAPSTIMPFRKSDQHYTRAEALDIDDHDEIASIFSTNIHNFSSIRPSQSMPPALQLRHRQTQRERLYDQQRSSDRRGASPTTSLFPYHGIETDHSQISSPRSSLSGSFRSSEPRADMAASPTTGRAHVESDVESVVAPSFMSAQWKKSPKERLGLGGRVRKSKNLPWEATGNLEAEPEPEARRTGSLRSFSEHSFLRKGFLSGKRWK